MHNSYRLEKHQYASTCKYYLYTREDCYAGTVSSYVFTYHKLSLEFNTGHSMKIPDCEGLCVV